MAQGLAGLEDYVLAQAGQRMEGARYIPLAVAGYGRLHLLVDKWIGFFKGPTRELALEHVAHVPNFGLHNLLSTRWLAQSFDASMRFYPATVILPRSGGKPFTF